MTRTITRRHAMKHCIAVLLAASTTAPTIGSAANLPLRLSVEKVDREPKEGRRAPTSDQLSTLRRAVTEAPKERGHRLALVQALTRAGQFSAALIEAKKWRARDAYNLVVVRMIGDLHTELGEHDKARRVYSAVVELLPKDPDAQRALATVLKQSGRLKAAYQRLTAAATLRPADQRIAFELADTAQRLGRDAEAARSFRAIVDSDKTPKRVRYPAKQRLAQLLAAHRRAALARKDGSKAEAAAAAIAALDVKGGVENDIKIYLTWDTNRSDVDLRVINPAGEEVFYSHKKGRFGGALFDDVTDGYGPESFTAKRARRGTYSINVNYFSTGRRSFSEARGEVTIVLDEGTRQERRTVLPYRLFNAKQTVTVARIRVR